MWVFFAAVSRIAPLLCRTSNRPGSIVPNSGHSKNFAAIPKSVVSIYTRFSVSDDISSKLDVTIGQSYRQ